nr:uncharacterized protein LOC126540256 [Dermacentor andersoni]
MCIASMYNAGACRSITVLVLALLCIRVSANTSYRETDARKVLHPPHDYWLLRRSHNANTTFATTKTCVQLEYIDMNETADLAMLDARKSGNEEWSPVMYIASAIAGNENKYDILQFSPFEDDSNAEIVTFNYQVLHVAQNSCYIVARLEGSSDTLPEHDNKRVHNCELWVKKEKYTPSESSSVTADNRKKCIRQFRELCSVGNRLYSKRACES